MNEGMRVKSLDGSVQGRDTFGTEFTVKCKNVLRLTIWLTLGNGLFTVVPRKYSSSCVVVLILITPGTWPPLNL
jgi:hypothetical protein